MAQLDKLIDPNDPVFGLLLNSAVGINEFGQIVATGKGYRNLYLLTPVPLPGSVLLFSAGLISLLRMSARKK
jgi:hypothetical protein